MEIELKLLVDPAHHQDLIQHPLLKQYALAKPRQTALHAIYFDTADQLLRKNAVGLRVRRENGKWIQNLKAGGGVNGGLHQRHEWETPVDAASLELGKLLALLDRSSPLIALLSYTSLRDRLQPLFTVEVTRHTWDLLIDGDDIEFVLDRGVIKRDGLSVPVSEIELELKSGKPTRLYEIALRLLNEVPLRPSDQSKAQCGYALGQELTVAAVKSTPVVLGRNDSIEQGFQKIIGNCLQQVQANEAGVRAGAYPESIHQMRVGLRRLRSALRMFDGIIPCPPALHEEIVWLSQELGIARDWDVLSESSMALLADIPEDIAFAPLQASIADYARQARAQAAQVLESSRYVRLLLSLHAWLQGVRWGDSSNPGLLRSLDTPIERFAKITLDRNRRRVLRRGRRIAQLSTNDLHRLRIACKHYRYSLDFFASRQPRKWLRNTQAALSNIQDELGWRNDFTVADAILRRMLERHPEHAAALHFSRGYLAAQIREDAHALRKLWRPFRALITPHQD